MSKKIVFIQGSPRKNGNTRAMTALAMASARENGAEVTEIDVSTLEFKAPGCVGCLKCQHSEAYVCAFDDELAHAVATLPQYDVIVLCTPLYWWSYSAQTKIFVDRMFSLIKMQDPENHQSLLFDKVLALLATAGGPIEGNLELLETQWKIPAGLLRCRFHSCLFPNTPPEADALVNDPSASAKAKAFGGLLASGESV